MIATTGEPLYQQVANDLRSQIAAGKLKVGDEIPSTAKLAEHHDVSIGVIRAAVKLLQEDGVLVGQSGRGVYVRATPETAATEAAALKSVDQQLADLREEVRRLAEQQPSTVVAKIEELQVDVARLHADLRHLYDRVGQPYPRHQNTKNPKRHSSGA